MRARSPLRDRCLMTAPCGPSPLALRFIVPPPRPGTAAGRRVCLSVGCGRLRAALCLSGLGTRPLSLSTARVHVTSVWSETARGPQSFDLYIVNMICYVCCCC